MKNWRTSFSECNRNKLTDNRKSQNGVVSTLLQSSSTLGTGKVLTHNERLEKEENIQVRHAMQSRIGKRKRRGDIMDPMDVVDNSEDEDEDESDEVNRSDKQSIPEPQFMVSTPSTEDRQMDFRDVQPISVANGPVVVGSALRKNKDGTVAAPIIRGKANKVLSQRQLNSRDSYSSYRPNLE